MSKNHLKSINAPKSWVILRKENKFVAHPSPGPHSMVSSIPICSILKEFGLSSNLRETKSILNSGFVSVDGRVVKDKSFPVGFMDVVSINGVGVFVAGLDTKGRIRLNLVSEDPKSKICKVVGKNVLGVGKIQINLSGGRCVLSDAACGLGDSLLIELPSQKILNHYPLKKGCNVVFIGGSHVGDSGVVESIDGRSISYKSSSGELNKTVKKYAYVIK